LVTVTLDKKIQLRWNAQNAESDFKGYHVFAYKGVITDLGTPAYPVNLSVDLTKNGQIPRCKDNTAIFEKFGFPASTADCDGDADTKATTTGSGAALADTDATTGATSTDDAPITNIAICDENTTDKTISLPGTVPTLTQQVCTISSIPDGKGGTTPLVNGTTYTFFVASVKGDKNNSISWTSNFVQDTPASSLYSDTLTVESGKYYMFDAANLTADPMTAYSAAPTGQACIDDVCKVNKINSESTLGLYIGRQDTTSNNYPQRAFLSVPKGDQIQIQLRGQQDWDLDKDGNKIFSTSIPGDQATSTYDGLGTLYPLADYQVYDIKVTKNGVIHYGKIVVGQISFDKEVKDQPADPIKVPLTIIMQPQANSVDYFQ